MSRALILAGLLTALTLRAAAGSWRADIEADWLQQARAWVPRGTPEAGDAAGAVDGVKDGKYAFHTAQEPQPWWQVDLGQPTPIGRLVVYNRLDYAPGLHNADTLRVLVSEDAVQWRIVHDQGGKHFGGISGAPPLDLALTNVRARYVRLQIPSEKPIFFHLDEVEVYGANEPARNLALRRPATQSSVSIWSTNKLPPPKLETVISVAVVRHFLDRARSLAADLRARGVNTTSEERELAAAESRLATTASLGPLYLEVRWTMRRLAFRHPALNFDRLLFVKRFTQETYPDVCLNHMPWVSRPGGDLCILTLPGAETAPQVTPLLNGRLGPGHVHGVELHWDARRAVFGYARAKSTEPVKGWLDRATNFELRRQEEPIHLYEISTDGSQLKQLTYSRDWSDLDPTYAPNDDIVFVSERCGYSLQCNEWDKDETSCNLYVMRPDGSGIKRLSVTKDGDYLPHTLDDGTIGYTRWEYQERGWAHIQSIWFVRPDGTGADALFKQHLSEPWGLEEARTVPGTHNGKLVCVATGHHTLPAGPVVLVTPSMGLNDPRGISIVTPGVTPPEGGMSGSPVPQGGVKDAGGYYMQPWPLSETTFLAAYTYGTGKTGVGSEVDPAGYALYLIDVFGTKELLYRDPAISSFCPMPLRPRTRPPVITDTTDATKNYAVCSLTDAAFGVDGVERKQARYLRVANRLPWPYDNTLGGQRYTEKALPNNWTPARVLGLVPLEADGSAHFKVPVDTAVYFTLLDENYMELRRMRSFISFQPGEQRGCVGCHETRAEAAPARPSLAARQEPVTLQPMPWGSGPMSFLRDVQPILDQHCVRCHSGLKPAAGLDFFGGLTSGYGGQASPIADYGFNRAFETMLQKKLVAISDVQGDAHITRPIEQGSHLSKLTQVVFKGMQEGRYPLTREEWLRLVTWVDLNAPYHDRFANKRPEQPPYSLPNDTRLLNEITTIQARRCAACHPGNAVTRLDWVDIHDPARSLFLSAPLTKEQGGTGKCSPAVYATTGDADYQAVKKLVTAAVDRTWAAPRRDLLGLRRKSSAE